MKNQNILFSIYMNLYYFAGILHVVCDLVLLPLEYLFQFIIYFFTVDAVHNNTIQLNVRFHVLG